MIDIEAAFNRHLKLTNDPVAAAVLVLAETAAGQQPQNALTVKQAAASLGVSVDTIYELCQQGRLAHQKIGRTIRIRPADLELVTTKAPKRALRCLRA